MRIRSSAVVFALLSPGLLSATHAAAPPVQGGDNKTVFVAALDAKNMPVAGLTKEGFAVREDGSDRTVVDVKPAADPLNVVLMIDVSQTSQTAISDLRSSLLAFSDALFAGSAPVVMSVMDVANTDPMVVTDKTTAADVDKVLTKTFADRAGNTVMLEALMDVTKKFAKATSARRAIVIVNMQAVPDASTAPPQKVLKAILDTGASVWDVTYRTPATNGLEASPQGAGSTGAQVFESLITNVPGGTGGLRLQVGASSALKEAITTLAGAIVGQYAVTYARPAGSQPKEVQIGASKPGVTILYPTTPIK
jgi:hypothetical protein